MSAVLLDLTQAFVRSRFTTKEVRDVKAYGGEFAAAEIPVKSYVCPAIFVTVLGWSPHPSGDRLRGRNVRSVSMAAFIACKHTDQAKRMIDAMNLADKLSLALSGWRPDTGNALYAVEPIDTDPVCENLYGRAVDKTGQALWMVRWTQDLLALKSPAELYDLVHVDITENVLPGVTPADPGAGPAVLDVTDKIIFQQP